MPGTTNFPGLDWAFPGTDRWTLAEAVGHAWVQQRAGGSVTVVGAELDAAWWPVLRAWLPIDAPLCRVDEGPVEPLPQRPFPPIHLSSLPRGGDAPWAAGSSVEAALAWLAARESALLVADAAPHPAVAVALGAVASWGWRVCWHLPSAAGLDEALEHIGRRQLPLHVVLDELPAVLPDRWLVVGHDELPLWLQHEWPTLYVPA